MKTRNLTLHYTLLQCFYWMGFAMVLGFTSVYMLGSGFTSTQNGLTVAVAGLISAVLQPIAAANADDPAGFGLKRIMLTAAAVTVAGGAAMLIFTGHKALIILFFGLCICLMQMMMSQMNALGVGSVNGGHALNIGLGRGLGSAAYAVTMSVLGGFVESRGANMIPMCLILFMTAFFFCLMMYPAPAAAPRSSGSTGGSVIAFLKKYPRYAGALAGTLLVFISHVLANSFAYQIALTKGGGSRETGIAMGIAAAVELPTMMVFSLLARKKPAISWFRISGIFATLKTLGMLLCTGVMGFYAVQFFQMGGWALLTVSSIFYINSIMEPGDTVKGQAYYGMTHTIGTVLGSMAGGWMIDALGVNVMLTAAVALSAAGTGVMLYFTRE